MSQSSIITTVAQELKSLDEKVVFAESCTGGGVSASLVQVEGISDHLCGSFVTYRPKSKRKWLGVKAQTIENYTCESQQVADQMAKKALRKTTEANWGVSVVGRVDGDNPFIFVSVWRRSRKDKIKQIEHFKLTLKGNSRKNRLEDAVEQTLTIFGRCLLAHDKKSTKRKKKEAA